MKEGPGRLSSQSNVNKYCPELPSLSDRCHFDDVELLLRYLTVRCCYNIISIKLRLPIRFSKKRKNLLPLPMCTAIKLMCFTCRLSTMILLPPHCETFNEDQIELIRMKLNLMSNIDHGHLEAYIFNCTRRLHYSDY